MNKSKIKKKVKPLGKKKSERICMNIQEQD